MKDTTDAMVENAPAEKSFTDGFKNSTPIYNRAVYETAVSIGIDVLNHIAKSLVPQDEPRFEDDGALTKQAQDELLNLGVDGFNDVMNWALVAGWINEEVVNEARKEHGLDPLA